MGIKQLSDESLQAQIIICMGVRTLAHLVRYDGEDLAPSVTFKVGSGGGAVNRPDDVMLVSTLLNWNYNNAKRLPRGATRLVVAGPKFTPEMKLFLTDAQSFYNRPSNATYGIASPLPLESTLGILSNYIVFQLFRAVTGRGDADTVIDTLATLPHLLHLRSLIFEFPQAGSETVHGGIPGSESAPGSGPTTN